MKKYSQNKEFTGVSKSCCPPPKKNKNIKEYFTPILLGLRKCVFTSDSVSILLRAGILDLDGGEQIPETAELLHTAAIEIAEELRHLKYLPFQKFLDFLIAYWNYMVIFILCYILSKVCPIGRGGWLTLRIINFMSQVR